MNKCAVAILAVLFSGAVSLAGAACGDGAIDGDESCDGVDLGGETCTTLTSGFVQGGMLACNPDCTFNTDDCRRAFVQSLIPARGGNPKNRCQLEWTVPGTTVAGGNVTKRVCSDGLGECDADDAFDNGCSFRVQFCLNVPDPKVPGCPFIDQAGKVFRFEVLQPRTGDAPQSLVDAAVKLATDAGGSANASATAASFSPPVTTFSCGATIVRVPLRGTTGRARPGKLRLKARSSDNSGKIRATGVLNLICNP